MKTMLILVAMAVSATMATNYYTDPGHNAADDNNPGTGTQPFQTISAARSHLGPGDTLFVKNGTYTEFNLDESLHGIYMWGMDGEPRRPVVFMAYPGHKPVIDQQGQEIAFNLVYCNYLVIDGFEMRNVAVAGVKTKGTNTHIAVKNCYIHHIDHGDYDETNVAGIKFDVCRNCTAENNVIHTARIDGQLNRNTAGIHSFSMEKVTIRNNEIYDVNEGIYHKRAGEDTGGVIIGNTFHDVERGILLSYAGSGSLPHQHHRILNNVFYSCNLYCIEAGREYEQCYDLEIANNIFANSPCALYIANYKDVRIYNNLFVDIVGKGPLFMTAMPLSGLVYSDYNMFCPTTRVTLEGSGGKTCTSLPAWQAYSNMDSHSVEGATPVFVDAANHDYRPADGSPVLGAGRGGSYSENIGIDTALKTPTAAIACQMRGIAANAPMEFVVNNVTASHIGLTVEASAGKDYAISLYDVRGAKVLEMWSEGIQKNVRVPLTRSLSAGTYVVRLTQSQTCLSRRFVALAQ